MQRGNLRSHIFIQFSWLKLWFWYVLHCVCVCGADARIFYNPTYPYMATRAVFPASFVFQVFAVCNKWNCFLSHRTLAVATSAAHVCLLRFVGPGKRWLLLPRYERYTWCLPEATSHAGSVGPQNLRQHFGNLSFEVERNCFFLRESERRVFLTGRSVTTSSHLHTFSSSILLIFSFSHLRIFSSSHLHVFSLLSSCPLALLRSCLLASCSLALLPSCPLALLLSCPLALLLSCPLALLPSCPLLSTSFPFLS